MGNTNRVDKGDSEIYMPNNVDDMYNYEYMFHTHPPTPKPGGRADVGIMYELPSIGDLLHFIDDNSEDVKLLFFFDNDETGMKKAREII